jgi:hypothetical protein
MQVPQQRKIVTVDRGLFLVRYAEADDASAPPTVRLSAAAGSREDLRFLLHPDETEAVLRHPGSSLVLRADLPGQIAMDIVPLSTNGSVAAKVRFEPLVQSIEPVRFTPDVAAAPVPNPLPDVLGHVASRGDVRVEAGSWLAGPAAPARIEGFAINWLGTPPAIDLRYAVKTARSRGTYEPWAAAGAFVGSRGRATPIVGLQVEVGGAAARHYHYALDLLFLGAPTIQLTGQRMEGAGPTGREPLVGLRLNVTALNTGARPTVEPPHRPAAIAQVKVFRSGTFGQRLPA